MRHDWGNAGLQHGYDRDSVRARSFLHDTIAGIKGIVGGEVAGYTKMLDEAREEALIRMIEQAEEKGADAVVMVRFSTSAIMRRSAELLAYGTAVKLTRTEAGGGSAAE